MLASPAKAMFATRWDEARSLPTAIPRPLQRAGMPGGGRSLICLAQTRIKAGVCSTGPNAAPLPMASARKRWAGLPRLQNRPRSIPDAGLSKPPVESRPANAEQPRCRGRIAPRAGKRLAQDGPVGVVE